MLCPVYLYSRVEHKDSVYLRIYQAFLDSFPAYPGMRLSQLVSGGVEAKTVVSQRKQTVPTRLFLKKEEGKKKPQ